jgi:hypothetical protein
MKMLNKKKQEKKSKNNKILTNFLNKKNNNCMNKIKLNVRNRRIKLNEKLYIVYLSFS